MSEPLSPEWRAEQKALCEKVRSTQLSCAEEAEVDWQYERAARAGYPLVLEELERRMTPIELIWEGPTTQCPACGIFGISAIARYCFYCGALFNWGGKEPKDGE